MRMIVSIVVAMRGSGAKSAVPGFAFSSFERPLQDGECYTLDADPNDWYGSFCASVVQELCAGGANTLYERLDAPATAQVTWPEQRTGWAGALPRRARRTPRGGRAP